MADHRHGRRIEGKQAEEIEHARRIGRRKVLDPAEERRVPHLDRDEQHLVEREEHRDLHEDGQAAGGRVHLLLLVQLHHRLLLAHAIVAVAVLELHQLGLELLHLAHRHIGFVREREEHELDEERDDEDGQAEIADELEEEVERVEHRLGEEIEPAPVDQEVEFGDLVFFGVAVDEIDFLRAGKDIALGLGLAAGWDGDRAQQIVRLKTLGARAPRRAAEARFESLALRGHHRGCPIFVGDAEPA